MKIQSSLDAQNLRHLTSGSNFEETKSIKYLMRSGRPKTLATSCSIVTELRQNSFASLRKITADVDRKLKF